MGGDFGTESGDNFRMIVGTVSRAHFGVGFGVAFWAATVSEAMIYYLN